MKRRGFTLIELMVVVTVIVILMSIAFKLAGLGGGQQKRSVTIKRLQCLHNALSGYYAAYGSYPPVKLHADRNIYLRTSGGHQDEEGATVSGLKWSSVKAALLAQPIDVAYPLGRSESRVRNISEAIKKKWQENRGSNTAAARHWHRDQLQYGFTALTSPGAMLKDKDAVDFNRNPVFKFGVLSYLLPRYLFMTKGESDLYKLNQWTYNNDDQKKCYADGRETYTWDDIRSDMVNNGGKNSGLVAMLPSQAVCARWLPNLKGIVSCFDPAGKTFYGVNVSTGYSSLHADNYSIQIYCPTGNKAQQYILDSMTVNDGWGSPFYYYSPQPYQGYKLWSAGPNGRTFPPWVEVSSLKGSDQTEAEKWMSDDVGEI